VNANWHQELSQPDLVAGSGRFEGMMLFDEARNAHVVIRKSAATSAISPLDPTGAGGDSI
jgi:hypothetical protein